MLPGDDSPEVDAASWARLPAQVHWRQRPLGCKTPPFRSAQRFPTTPASCSPVLFYQPLQLPKHPSLHPLQRGPGQGQLLQLTRVDSSTWLQHSTCSHTCRPWARPGFSAAARLPTVTPVCLDQLPFPAFPVLWPTWQGTGRKRGGPWPLGS